MTAAFRTPGSKIALAITLSLIIHAAILWLPYINLPQPQVEFPPLSVRLAPLPTPVKLVTEKPEHGKPAPSNDLVKSDHKLSARSASKSMAPMNKTKQNTAAQPFPKHMHLSFIVYKGEDGLRTGEIRQQFDISDGRYALRSVRETSGLASLRNDDRIIQSSHGNIDEHGLHPDLYEVEKITVAGKLYHQSLFDHKSGTLRFSDGSSTALPTDMQDSLSFMYQLSQLPINVEFFTLPVSDTGQLRQYQIEIGTREDIDTPIGKLRTLHLREMHASGSAYFEIWLGLEYRRLPVKFREVDSSGKVIDEYVISGIRASDK
ncbi:MAG TPA: DUF3108 domain-containing protein [Gallionella sp.]|nr:DUF3108 domain-containing protein [Gallionella sp.]